MGLFLPYEAMWDMPLDGRESGKRIPHWFGNLAYALVGAVFKLCFRYRVSNREALRGFEGKSGAVVICNHTSFLDVAVIYLTARPAQWIRLMGRDSLFGKAGGLLGQVLSRVGAFPVKRDSADRTSVKRAVRMLKDGELVGILPEGTRRGKSDRAPELHAGAAFIARMAHVPILPMCVRDVEKVKQKGERLRFPQVTAEFGEPLLVGDFDFLPKEKRLDGCAWYAMRECFALHDRVPREQVDMLALFPDAEDFTATFAEHPLPSHSTAEVVAALKAGDAEGGAAAEGH